MLKTKEVLNGVEEFLITALNEVAEEYFEMGYANVKSGFQKPERAFNAELYHQLRKLQENIGNNDKFKIHPDLIKHPFKLHLELVKAPSSYHRNIQCIGDFYPKKISPDIVFHGGQNNLKNQSLVAELKMDGTNTVNIIKDFQKLLFYKLSYLNFENAVFIYTGTKSDIEEKLVLGLNEHMLECLMKSKIVIAVCEKNNKIINWSLYEFDRNQIA